MILAVANLNVAAPAGAADVSEAKKQEEAGKVVCRKQFETGSFVKKTKVCRTRAQWEAISRAARNSMDESRASGSQSGN